MFPEHRKLIAELRQTDTHFKKLFERHNEIDHLVKNIESGNTSGNKEDLARLKKEKLALKDDLYKIIKEKQA